MAGPTGFEPAISSVTGWHVWPLHHGPAGVTRWPSIAEIGKRLQKADPDLRSPTSRMTTRTYAPAPIAAATAAHISTGAWAGDATALVPAAAPSATKVAARTADRRIPKVEPQRRCEATPMTTST